MPARTRAPQSNPLVEAARRAPWPTAFLVAVGIGAAVFLIGWVNAATAWRADAREGWSVALLVLFIVGGLADLTPPAGPPAGPPVGSPAGPPVGSPAGSPAGAAATRPGHRAWALAHPWRFALLLALGCGLAVGLSDLNLWHAPPRTALVHAAIQAALVALVGPVHTLSGRPPGSGRWPPAGPAPPWTGSHHRL